MLFRSKIKALILVEPSATTLYAQANWAALKGVPVLVVYGDYWKDSPRWVKTRASVDNFVKTLQAAGAKAEMMDLPARGIAGNSHMLMMDHNSDQIAGLIQAWLAGQGLMK